MGKLPRERVFQADGMFTKVLNQNRAWLFQGTNRRICGLEKWNHEDGGEK